jgi:hypothetical protein
MRGHIRKYKLKTGGELLAAVVYQGKRFGRDGKVRDSYRWIRGFETRNAAAKGLRKILTSIDEETYVEPSKQNLADYLNRWLSAAKANLAPKTFEHYKQLVEVNNKPGSMFSNCRSCARSSWPSSTRGPLHLAIVERGKD